MKEIIIDEEFRFLLPTLDEITFRLLEESILQYGCRNPLVLWNGILIDGYNRYKICMEHELPFTTVNMEFDSREEVLIWIISNQVSNRTIRRDGELAMAVKAIGGVSSKAKVKLLSGQVKFSKNKLRELSTASKEEIEAIATQIERGEYEGRTPRQSTSDKSNNIPDSIHPEIKQLSGIISDFANDFQLMFLQLNNGDSVDLKVVLRAHIDQLEDLYNRMVFSIDS